MLVVSTNQTGFEYDIHSLVKAFYPEQEVKVYQEKELDKDSSSSDENIPDIHISFEEDKILIMLSDVSGPSSSFLAAKIGIDSSMERPDIKNALKQLIYHHLAEYTGKQLPWGTLTGIRPTKIPMNLLEQGMSEEDILNYMQATYFISAEKGRLALDIARREREILAGIHYQDGYSLYIGIPFCPTTCLYCSFTSYPIAKWQKRVDEYLDALEKEIIYTADAYRDKILDSIYIGGGTPTTLEPAQLERLLSKVCDSFDFSQVKEFTVEAGRADSITAEKLQVLKKYGVSRISINPQTMKQETLKIIGRQHTVEQIEEAFKLARTQGFTNINMDLILGLPGETKEDVAATIAAVTQLKPDGLTIHSLAVKRASGLNQWIEENGMDSLRNTEETMTIAMKGAEEMGMHPYYLYRQKNMAGNFENIGYATPGNYGIYNILIMEELQTIVALGAGTITKRVYADGRIERCDNVKDVALYIEKIDEMIERKNALLN